MAISTVRQAGHPNGIGYNTRASMKTGGSLSYGPTFGTLGTGYIDSKFSAEQTRINATYSTYQVPYVNDLWLDAGTDPVRLLPNASDTVSIRGLHNVLFVNKGSPDIYIYINYDEGIVPSFSGALILASGESYVYNDIIVSAYAHMDINYVGSGHIYCLGNTPYNYRTM